VEPNRTSEERLKALAKRRREEAGEFELHPANRRRLQEAVASTFSSREPGLGLGNFFARFWPRLAFAAGAAGLVALLVLVLAPDRQSAEFTIASGPAREVAPAPEMPARPAQKEPADLLTESVPATLPELEGQPPPPEALRSALEDRAAEIAGVPRTQAAPPLRMETPREPAVPAQPDMLLERADAADIPEVARWHFVQKVALQPKQPQVLSNFEMEFDGKRVRIVDADGSIYEGAPMPARGRLEPRDLAPQRSARPLGSQSPEVADPLLFRVSGTNRTLKQTLQFDGEVTTQTAVPTRTLRLRSAPAELQTVVSGNVVLEGKEKQSIHAVAEP
jgi:hypothetical protein